MNADISPSRSSLRGQQFQQLLQEHGYTLHETLGVGGYSKVKLARKGRSQYAVKIILKAKAPDTYLAKFLPREIAALQQLSHPHVIKLEEVIELPDRLCLVTELAAGGDLLQFINESGCVGEREAARLFRQLLLAVDYCHGQGFVHRDLKCENVLLDADGRIKLSDFGFATPIPTGPSTALHTHCGSYAYAAPEILFGEPYDGTKSDVWSLGVVLYAMTVGRLPFNDCNMKVLLAQVQRPLELPLRLSHGLCDILRRMLSVDVGKRASIADTLQHPWMYPDSPAAERVSKMSTRLQKLSVTMPSSPAAGSPPPRHAASSAHRSPSPGPPREAAAAASAQPAPSPDGRAHPDGSVRVSIAAAATAAAATTTSAAGSVGSPERGGAGEGPGGLSPPAPPRHSLSPHPALAQPSSPTRARHSSKTSDPPYNPPPLDTRLHLPPLDGREAACIRRYSAV